MDQHWRRSFRRRMDTFHSARETSMPGIAVSIKIRVLGGCFHRDCSPEAWMIIDDYMDSHPIDDVPISL
jgi:hypothetical protein